MRRANIFVQDQLAGSLEEYDRGYRFSYTTEYLSEPEGIAVSLSLPLRSEPYEDKRLFPFFDGLIPEGWLLELAEATWKLNPRDRMGLLLACCNDCIGAVSVFQVEEGGHDV